MPQWPPVLIVFSCTDSTKATPQPVLLCVGQVTCIKLRCHPRSSWLLQDRGYVVKEGRALRPESRGRVLSSFLRAFFPQYVDYGFTALLEDQLDEVSGPALSRLSWIP